MNRHTLTLALCSIVLAATTALVPTAHAGNVAWGVSVGGPGFQVTAGQPAYYRGRGFHGAPYRPIARPYFPLYYQAAFRAAVVVPPVFYAPPPVAYPYYAPAPVVIAPRRVIYAPRPFAYAYSGYGPGQMQSAPNSGSY